MIKPLNLVPIKNPLGPNKTFFFVLILGFFLSGPVALRLYLNELEISTSHLNQIAQIRTEVMKKNVESSIEAVLSIKALYSALRNVNTMDFERFASVEKSPQSNLQAVSWAPRVRFSERKQFEATARDNGLVNFSLMERSKAGAMVVADRRDEYYPVHYIYPVKDNEAAVGFDLASNLARREAIYLARDTGQMQFTKRLSLVQETGDSYGILALVPIYKDSNVPKTIAERQEKIKGVASGVFRISDILSSEKFEPDHVGSSYLFDMSADKGQQILFPVGSDIQDPTDLKSKACVQIPIYIGGRNWVSVHCKPEDLNIFWQYHLSLIALFGTLSFSMVVAFYLRNIAKQKISYAEFVRNLQASENRYRDLVDNTSVLIQSFDVESQKLVFVNNGWLAALGYDDDDIVNLSMADIVAAEQLDHCNLLLKKVVESAVAQKLVTTFVRKDGGRLNVQGHIICRENAAGRIITHGVFTDETDRQKAEMEKIKIGLELTQLIDTANAPIFGIDAAGLVNDWNQRAELLTEYAKADVMGKDLVAGFITDDYRASVKEVVDKALQGEESANYEFPLFTKSGDRVDVLLNLTTRRDYAGNIVGVVGVGQDITELNKIRKEQESVAKDLTQLIDTANAPIFGIDAAGLVNEWNQRAELLTEYAKADVMGKDLVAGFITDDYKASVKEVLDKALQGEESANYEFPLFTKSGDRVDVLLNSTTRRDSAGNIVGVVGVGQDITELKYTQAQVIQSSKLATLGEMATSVAHELNQPLNVIRMAAGNARGKISKGNPSLEYLNEKLERIESQTARAAAIIDHMRMFGRKAEEKPELIDPRQVVKNALGLMGEQLRLDGIEIITTFPDTCSQILGHTIQMEQVILNLMANARDVMANMDGDQKILLGIFEDDNGVHITSEDMGGGIPEEVLPRIFEPFFTTKEMGKGTGLGLSVSYGIIRDMNGTITAGNFGGGARFTITIPAAT
jgi:PAS domain S-box-containing protein